MSDGIVSPRLQRALDALANIESDERPYSLVDVARISYIKASQDGPVEDTVILPEVYKSFIEKRDELEDAEDEVIRIMKEEDSGMEVDSDDTPKKKRSPRKHKHLRPYYLDNDGNIKFLMPTETTWYLVYLKNPELVQLTPKFVLKFRRRFRMPYPTFIDFLAKVKLADNFERWNDKKDAVGQPSSPIGLLLLGALRYLGRGLTFDDLEEYTSIDEETHRQFFHVFH